MRMKRISIDYQDGWHDPDMWYWMRVTDPETGKVVYSETSESSTTNLDPRAKTALLIDYLHKNPEEIVEIKNKEDSNLIIIAEAHNYAISVRARGKGEKYIGQVICERAVERGNDSK